MNRFFLWTAVLLSGMAGCGKDSAPFLASAPELAKYDFVGDWQGLAEQFKWKENYFFLNDRMPEVKSLICILSVDEDTYRLEMQRSNDQVDLTFLEEGRWSWFKESKEFLFFDALKENFNETLKRPGSQSNNSLSWREQPGQKRSWKCNFEYDPEKKTIRLFNFDNLYDYGSIELKKN
ncbi:MAG: hypothetical protein A3F83_10370 [Candidatus Glassbacteria bacterium RIFCSPLOWO2_12_FULL_58_11]|uniref:Uncharacterized protein n=1 Tax=Candidatus Glassbacteria bacterium RIFCSPLOWO2_12_FULL_58_11 TaxID=1817867 RepID=A0A1F5YYG9_9BACT|nr:MAG: hypothetical protein A3F83_10370 [Candidatus Glassbacteria bacterium RIFCSPLOWO2_12_FULL_58_11]